MRTPVDITSLITLIVGILLTLAGVLALIAVAHPSALGALNALSSLGNLGGSLCLVGGSVLNILAIAIPLIIHSFQQPKPTVRDEIPEEESEDENEDLDLGSTILRDYKNPKAMSRFVSGLSKKDLRPLGELLSEPLGDSWAPNKALVRTLQKKPKVFREVVTHNFTYIHESTETTYSDSHNVPIWLFTSAHTRRNFFNVMLEDGHFTAGPDRKLLFVLVVLTDHLLDPKSSPMSQKELEEMRNSLLQNLVSQKDDDGIDLLEMAFKTFLMERDIYAEDDPEYYNQLFAEMWKPLKKLLTPERWKNFVEERFDPNDQKEFA